MGSPPLLFIKRRAFTLIELLAAIAVIAVLSGIVYGAVASARKAGNTTREVSAARQLIAAYLAAAAQREGELMVGYSATETAVDELGENVPNPSCGRYPWRLAPFLQYQIRGTILVGEQEKIALIPERGDYVYRVSAHPSFGINATYVGGNERTGLMPTPSTKRRFGEFVATHLAHVTHPQKLIVFASSRFKGGSNTQRMDGVTQAGFHLITPPRTARVEWRGPFDPARPAEQFGFIDLRHSSRAVCAMLDGHVELLNATQLQDMRHWSALAAEADDPEFLLKPNP